MQVNHVQEKITHAVIGASNKEAIHFGISSDAAFFQILSSSLYKNPMLAMVRETICNAWDAHIASECTDKPIEVCVNKTELVIKDFGQGIPDDLIGPVYAIYGGSTKKHDGAQTGGFGLGCKSPFAYTDHFEVTSCHEGIKTIYRMSKSSGEVMGKPSIQTILSVPTEESGITVRIPLKPDSAQQDQNQIHKYIDQVIYNGGILAINDNGDYYGNIDYSDKTGGPFTLLYTASRELGSVRLKYGNVLYPVDTTTNQPELKALVEYIQSATNRFPDHLTCILHAPPHSVSVAPSREELSYQDNTRATLESLAKQTLGALGNVSPLVKERRKEIFLQKLDAAKNKDELVNYALNWYTLDNLFDLRNSVNRATRSMTMQEYVDTCAGSYTSTDTDLLIAYLKEHDLVNRKVFNYVLNTTRQSNSRATGLKIYHQLFKKLHKFLRKEENFSISLPSYSNFPNRLTQLAVLLGQGIPVVLTRSVKNAGEVWEKHPDFVGKDALRNLPIYIRAKSGKAAEILAKRLSQLNHPWLRVVDLYTHQDWMGAPAVKETKPRKPAVRKKAVPGYTMLSNFLTFIDGSKPLIKIANITYEEPLREANPEYVIQFSPNSKNTQLYSVYRQTAYFSEFLPFSRTPKLGGLGREDMCTIGHHFCNRIAVVKTKQQLDKALKNGAKLFTADVVDNYIQELIDKDPEIREAIATNGLCSVHGRQHWEYDDHVLEHPDDVLSLQEFEPARKLLGLPAVNISSRAAEILELIAVHKGLDLSSIAYHPKLVAVDKQIVDLPGYKKEIINKLTSGEYDLNDQACSDFIGSVLKLVF